MYICNYKCSKGGISSVGPDIVLPITNRKIQDRGSSKIAQIKNLFIFGTRAFELPSFFN